MGLKTGRGEKKRKKKALDINVVDLLYFGQASGSFLKK